MKVSRYILLMFAIIIATAMLYAMDVSDIIELPKTGHRKPPIFFHHKDHVEKHEAVCIDCHHKGTNKKCSECHKMQDQGQVINLKGAFHQQCHDCHRRTSGPRACGRCHVPVSTKGISHKTGAEEQ